MIDPGHPFSVQLRDLIASLESSIRNGVEEPDRTSFIFDSAIRSYPLPGDTYDITRVSEGVDAGLRVFVKNQHYELTYQRLGWIAVAPEHLPTPGARVDVEYTRRVRPAGLTDFNPGSVVGTLVRAVAREMKLLYEQMDQAYRRAFIEVAQGAALDNVVALLGVERNPAQPARGHVTFFYRQLADDPVDVEEGTEVADGSSRRFRTVGTRSIADRLTEDIGHEGQALTTAERIGEVIELVEVSPEGAPLAMDPEAGFGEDGRTLLLTTVPTTSEVRVSYRPLSVTVPVEAVESGLDGNVNAGTITVMPTPPDGVVGVENRLPIKDGQEAELDDRLRVRAQHALERSGNATLDAIKFAVFDVDGVQDVNVSDHRTDDSIPLGEVRVRYSGGKLEDVRCIVDETRAAGVIAQFDEVNEVLIQGTFYLVPDIIGADPTDPADEPFIESVIKEIEKLGIGQALSLRRLTALAYNYTGSGLAEVADASLRFSKANSNDPAQPIEGDVLIASDIERIRPKSGSIHAVVLDELKAEGDGPQVEVSVLTADGSAAQFRSVEMPLLLTLRAAPAASPDNPPVQVGEITRTALFVGSDTTSIPMSAADLDVDTPADYHLAAVRVALRAPAWPALGVATTLVDLSG